MTRVELMIAIWDGKTELVQRYLSEYPKSNLNWYLTDDDIAAGSDKLCSLAEFSQYTPIQLAISRSQSVITSMLIDADANLNFVDASRTDQPITLLDAMRNLDICVVKKLINQGADIKVKTLDMQTPLHVAVGNPQYFDVTRLLIKAGADVNAKAHQIKCPLSVAICALSRTRSDLALRTVEALIEAGADVDSTDAQVYGAYATAIREQSAKQYESVVRLRKERNSFFSRLPADIVDYVLEPYLVIKPRTTKH